MNINTILQNSRFEDLPLFFEGGSRIIRATDNPKYLISKLKPTIFSLKAGGPIPLPGIDDVRTQLNAIFCEILRDGEIQTSTLATQGDLILLSNEKVPPIEVVVKGALVGSPKHIYKGIGETIGRKGSLLPIGTQHSPYVRFDWRNPLPEQDACMPEGLADFFIDTQKAEQTAIQAFQILKKHLNLYQLDILDICFFMNETGDCICGEVSTDNSQIIYTGDEPDLIELFSIRNKEFMLAKAQKILKILKSVNRRNL